LFRILLVSLVVALFVGCQPPQVPQYEATPSPSAFRVAYIDDKSLNMMHVDGTEVTPLAHDLQPTECAPYYVSPNGQWIAYQQADDGLWIAPTQGGSPSMLTGAMAGSVSWFPDSSGVVYTLEDGVYAQWLDSSQPRRPLASGGRRYLFPTWSPDGKYIAFLETTEVPHVFNVIIIQSDGTGWRTLGATAPEPSEEQRLCPDIVAWSPDSTRFLVDFGDPAFAFYVAGGSPVQMGAGRAPTHHAWSSDGRNLTYQDEEDRLWLAKADGSGHKLLTDFPVSEAVWSPHNSQVAYISQRDGDSDLEVMDTETNETRSLTGADNYLESNPSWTPDGLFLIFARHVLEEDTSSEVKRVSAGIWRVPADGSDPPQRLALTGDSPRVFAIR
jgi:Tol biopolymer transport system component